MKPRIPKWLRRRFETRYVGIHTVVYGSPGAYGITYHRTRPWWEAAIVENIARKWVEEDGGTHWVAQYRGRRLVHVRNAEGQSTAGWVNDGPFLPVCPGIEIDWSARHGR